LLLPVAPRLLLLLLLEELGEAPERDAGVLAAKQHLRHLGRRRLHAGEQLPYLREQRVVVDEEVVVGERLERLPAAVAHVDVHVHPPRPEQALLVVGGEHDDALVAGRRPQPVDEVEQPGQRDL
ncbi:Os07g0517467, partial [Oryza sativa Japonica Group]